MNFSLSCAILKKGKIDLYHYSMWSLVIIARKLVDDKRVTITSEWLNYKRNSENSFWNYPLPDIKEESTFEKCVSASLSYDEEEKKIIFRIHFNESDSFDGYPNGPKCEFILSLGFLPEEFEEYLQNALKQMAEENIQAEKREIYRLRVLNEIENIKKKLLFE